MKEKVYRSNSVKVQATFLSIRGNIKDDYCLLSSNRFDGDAGSSIIEDLLISLRIVTPRT